MVLRPFFRSSALASALAAALLAAGCAGQKGLDTAGLDIGAGEAGLNAGINGPNGGAGAPGSTQEFQVSVGDRVFFLEDSSSLTGQAQATLDRQAQWLNQYARYGFTIEGHADERGTREYNLALGARRAATVRDYLAARGVDPGRIRTVSYGKERPAAVCDAESCWTQNRRAVTALDGASS